MALDRSPDQSNSSEQFNLDKHPDKAWWQLSQKCDHYSVYKVFAYLGSVTLFLIPGDAYFNLT
jgi:hypothetical protein